MKVTVEVDCSPEEARAFLGLPDVTALNDHLVAEMKSRMDANMAQLQPDELFKNWMTLGGAAQEQFFRLMQQASASAFTPKG